MTKRRLLWVVGALVVLVALRFVVRWADATSRLPPPGELAATGITVLVVALLAAGVVVLLRRQTRKNR